MNPFLVVGGAGAGLLLAVGASANNPFDATAPAPVDNPLDQSGGDNIPYTYGSQQVDTSGNLAAFLMVLRLGESSNRYNALYGGGTFSSYAWHPAINTPLHPNPNPFRGSNNSHAAGAYQFEPATWVDAANALNLPDFSPASQDRAAVWDLKRRNAYDPVQAGDIYTAMVALQDEWTSLADRGQSWVVSTYQDNGGVVTT